MSPLTNHKGCGAVDGAAPPLTSGLGFEPRVWKNPWYGALPLNGPCVTRIWISRVPMRWEPPQKNSLLTTTRQIAWLAKVIPIFRFPSDIFPDPCYFLEKITTKICILKLKKRTNVVYAYVWVYLETHWSAYLETHWSVSDLHNKHLIIWI